jgi:proline racemase
MRLSSMITAVDAHAAGEPGRVITGGVLDVPGATMFEKMVHLRDHRDEIRKRLLFEPRGYPGLCANLILPPTCPEADAGFVIMEPAEYAFMSGSNTICVTTVLLETGMLPMREPVTEITLEAPAGLVRVRADCKDGKVTAVTFRNVPAFAIHLDRPVEVPGVGTVTVDVAYGGMMYAMVEAAALGLRLTPDEGRDITRLGEMV